MSLTNKLAESRINAYFDLMETRPELFPMKSDISTDKDSIMDYAIKNDKAVGVVYESPWHYLIVDVIVDSNGSPHHTYERYVSRTEQAGGVIVPILEDGRICLLEHYRYTLGRSILELPRGFAEEGESGWEAAVRELAEELGAVPVEITVLGQIIPDSGVNGNEVTIVKAKIESYELGQHDADEHIDGVRLVTLDELDEMIASDKIIDGFTLAARGMLAAETKR